MPPSRPLRDPRLKFYPRSHTYRLGKKKLRSVTEWLKDGDEFNAKEKARELAALPHNKAQKRGVRYWLNKWNAIRDNGTKIHWEIEQHLLTKEPAITPATLAATAELYSWPECVECNLHPEVRVYAEELLLAGTIDLVIEDANNVGSVIIVDWKTNTNLNHGKLEKYALQINTYAYILEKYYGYNVTGLRIVHINETVKTHDIKKDYTAIEQRIKEEQHE